jgi:hypothetical protein
MSDRGPKVGRALIAAQALALCLLVALAGRAVGYETGFWLLSGWAIGRLAGDCWRARP